MAMTTGRGGALIVGSLPPGGPQLLGSLGGPGQSHVSSFLGAVGEGRLRRVVAVQQVFFLGIASLAPVTSRALLLCASEGGAMA